MDFSLARLLATRKLEINEDSQLQCMRALASRFRVMYDNFFPTHH